MAMKLMWLLLLLGGGAANEDAKRLFEDLMIRYNKLSRPIRRLNETVEVKFRLSLDQIVDVVNASFSWSSSKGR